MITAADIQNEDKYRYIARNKCNNGCGRPCEHGGECNYHLRHEGKMYHVSLGLGPSIALSIRCVIGEVMEAVVP